MKFVLASAFCLIAFATQAMACQCADQRPCEAYGVASAVFVGTVTFSTSIKVKEIDHEYTNRLVRLHVDRAIRNVDASDVEVMTGWGEADCGFPFRLGGQYLVYAHDQKGKLVTSSCTRTRPISDATADLEYIEGLSKAAPGGTISGEVVLRRRDLSTATVEYELTSTPVKDVKILLEGNKKSETKTDAEGKYSVSGLPPGKYKVRIELPTGLSIYNPEVELELRDRACREADFAAEPDTRITGRVLDAQAMPAADLLMELVPAVRKVGFHPDFVKTDKDGRFVMRLMKPGPYYVGVRIAGSAGSTYVPYPQTYYPGVKDRSQATVITIDEGQQIELDQLVLPARFIERTLNGTVVDPDGTPVAGAVVWLKERQYEDADMPYRRETDSEGRFSYSVYEGIKYELNAYVESGGQHVKKSETFEIVITSNPEPVKLVVKKVN